MSIDDRKTWNQRYQEGFYADRMHPTRLLENNLAALAPGRALDIACGAGRNARFLAKEGYTVVGVDVSDVALEQAKEAAAAEDLDITYIQHDLDIPLPPLGKFDLISIIRYVNRPLLQQIHQFLSPGGNLVIELHLKYDLDDRPLAGPTAPEHRMADHELSSLVTGVEVEYAFEGLIIDPDGREAAITQLIGRRPD